MKDRLTKSAYLKYLKCPQEFWLSVNQPLLFAGEADSLEYEHLRQQGYAVQMLVKRMARFQTDEVQIVDFERVFQTSELYVRSDMVVTNRQTGTVDIYEIKASG